MSKWKVWFFGNGKKHYLPKTYNKEDARQVAEVLSKPTSKHYIEEVKDEH